MTRDAPRFEKWLAGLLGEFSAWRGWIGVFQYAVTECAAWKLEASAVSQAVLVGLRLPEEKETGPGGMDMESLGTERVRGFQTGTASPFQIHTGMANQLGNVLGDLGELGDST